MAPSSADAADELEDLPPPIPNCPPPLLEDSGVVDIGDGTLAEVVTETSLVAPASTETTPQIDSAASADENLGEESPEVALTADMAFDVSSADKPETNDGGPSEQLADAADELAAPEAVTSVENAGTISAPTTIEAGDPEAVDGAAAAACRCEESVEAVAAVAGMGRNDGDDAHVEQDVGAAVAVETAAETVDHSGQTGEVVSSQPAALVISEALTAQTPKTPIEAEGDDSAAAIAARAAEEATSAATEKVETPAEGQDHRLPVTRSDETEHRDQDKMADEALETEDCKVCRSSGSLPVPLPPKTLSPSISIS